jgi:hypothetical protein
MRNSPPCLAPGRNEPRATFGGGSWEAAIRLASNAPSGVPEPTDPGAPWPIRPGVVPGGGGNRILLPIAEFSRINFPHPVSKRGLLILFAVLLVLAASAPEARRGKADPDPRWLWLDGDSFPEMNAGGQSTSVITPAPHSGLAITHRNTRIHEQNQNGDV